MGGRRRRERVNGERGWRERRLLLSRLSWRSSKVLLIIFKHSSCGSVCASTFFILMLFLLFLILLLLSLLCACLYISVVLFYRWLITPASSSPCVHWASLCVYDHPRFSSCISVFLSCTLLYSPWILQMFFLFLDFNVVVVLFLSFFVKYLQICIFLLKILDILHLFAFLPVVPMSVGAVLH